MCVGLCYRGKEGRGKRAPHVRRVRDRDLFDIDVGQVNTLVQSCRARERLGTLKIQLPRDQRDACVRASLSAAEGNLRKARRYAERDLRIVVGKLETLAFFF